VVGLAEPVWIIVGIVCCVLIWLLWNHQEHRKNRRLTIFAAPALIRQLTANVSTTRRTTKKLLLIGTIFCCFVALARPQYGTRWIDVKHKGIDILFALDTSRSMLAEDIRPNRLERSKLAIMDFVSQLTGDRVGLLPFAGSSYLMCPLTSDYLAFEQSLKAIDTSVIPLGGTDIGEAIKAAEKIEQNEASHKILILITDGENLEGDAVAVAAQTHQQGLTIFTVGVGTEAGELVPDQEKGGFIKDDNGNYVKSRLDRHNLALIGEKGGGFYVPLGTHGEGLETIYRKKLAMIPKTELAEMRKKVPIERFQWPLIAALSLLIIEFLLSGRKNDRLFSKPLFGLIAKKKKSLVVSLIAATLLPIFLTPSSSLASPGERAFNEQKYSESLEYYKSLLEKDPNNPLLLFDHGAAAYKNNQFDEAAEDFDKALTSDDIKLQEKAYFNKGNALYKKGENTLQSDPSATAEAWQHALDAFSGAQSLNPDNRESQENYTFVKNKLEQLKKERQKDSENSSAQDQEQNQSPGNQQDQQSEQSTQNTDNKQSEPSQPEQKAEPSKTADKSTDGTPKRSELPTNQQTPPDRDSGDATDANRSTNQAKSDDNSVNGEAQGLRMNKDEAEQLLKAIQAEEGRLDLFGSESPKSEQQRDQQARRDW